MSSPREFHDTSEQTPLLAGHSAAVAGNTPDSARSRSFLPSLLPWCKNPSGENSSPQVRKGGNGTAFPPRPPPNGGKNADTTGTTPSSSATNGPGNNQAVTCPGPAHSPAVSSSSTSGEATLPAWGDPAGLDPRKANDENVVIFREAIGIPTRTIATTPAPTAPPSAAHDPEPGVVYDHDGHRQQPTGIYARILAEKQAKIWQASVLNSLVNACHVAQILVGACLTTLGPSAQDHSVSITVLGATNTVLAGVFALLKGQGLPDRLRKDATAFRRVQDWIEETDALLVAGVVGRDRREVGVLVETAFQKYNAVVARSEEAQPPEDATSRGMPPVPTAGQDLLAVGSGGVGADGDADDTGDADDADEGAGKGASTADRRESQAASNGEDDGDQAAGKTVAKVSSVQVE
ncbi:hypothetical protein SCUCBS95973_008775 [Sporothrix curviconia]|uniref:SMODS and SLOG-associating 2TM effector domain-containing protein n=1 Tax=Sporothrix curviconia TaxID=1260050 RepID=A0ABP0CPA6_9PEZI